MKENLSSISVSIVLYNNSDQEVSELLNNLLILPLPLRLYVVNNSPTDTVKYLISALNSPKIEYIYAHANLGYGKGHNLAFEKLSTATSDYHIVLNPDIKFTFDNLSNMIAFMESNKDVGLLMPKVFYEDGQIQRLCKLLPTPLDLIGRRFLSGTRWAKRRNDQYELKFFDYNRIINTASISGCFMFFRTSVLLQTGGFDPRYFMYLEDYDLARRTHSLSRTIFYPGAFIIHKHKKESYVNPKLLRIHMFSAIKYFNKWGWFNDKKRSELNKQLINEIKKHI